MVSPPLLGPGSNGSRVLPNSILGSAWPVPSKGRLVSAYNLHRVRMVIQQIGGFEVAYRAVVYGDGERPRHVDFKNGQVLLQALHAALPDFDTSSLSLGPLREGQGSIVFADEVELSDQQLGLLGLTNFSN